MNGLPVAYIRRSVTRRSDPGDVSRSFQTDKVRALANGDGAALRVIDGDWGKSAAEEKTGKRLAFLAMLEDIEAGHVSTLYAYSADRLARSVQWSARLLDACEHAGTTIVTSEGRFAPGDDMARQMFHFQAMQNEGALRQMTRKAQATADVRRARGDVLGRKPYGSYPGEDPEHVVAAFVAAGSYLQAARDLNAERWPTRFGKSWDPTTVRHVVQRARPGLIPLRPRRGSRTRARRILSGLLRCPCARTLTSMPTAWGVRYWCPTGHSDPTHPRPYMVAESKLMPWVKAEAERIYQAIRDREGDAVERDAANDVDRARLDAKRERIIDLAADGVIDKTELVRRLAVVDAALGAIVTEARLEHLPAIDWTWDPGDINAILRQMWTAIVLGPDLMPVRAETDLPAEYMGVDGAVNRGA